jgi:hypothetical protein
MILQIFTRLVILGGHPQISPHLGSRVAKVVKDLLKVEVMMVILWISHHQGNKINQVIFFTRMLNTIILCRGAPELSSGWNPDFSEFRFRPELKKACRNGTLSCPER